MVVPTVPTTQQTLVIFQFHTKNRFHWLRHFCQYYDKYLPFPNAHLNMGMTHIYPLIVQPLEPYMVLVHHIFMTLQYTFETLQELFRHNKYVLLLFY